MMLSDKVAIPFSELKGFPGGGVSGHGRDLLIGTMGGKRIAILTGREHYYEHGNAAAMRPALETLAELGAKTLLLTNSAGSLDRRHRPGDLMLIADHINYAGMNPLIGEPTDRRFVNMVNAYDPGLRRKVAGTRRPPRHSVEGGHLSLVFWPVLRDGGRNPDGHPARRQCGGHVHRARSDPRPHARPARSGPARRSPTWAPAFRARTSRTSTPKPWPCRAPKS